MRYTITIALPSCILALGTQTASAAASRKENWCWQRCRRRRACGRAGWLVFGAAIGAKLGDSSHKKSERIETLEDSLHQSHQSVASLESGIDELSLEVERLQKTGAAGTDQSHAGWYRYGPAVSHG